MIATAERSPSAQRTECTLTLHAEASCRVLSIELGLAKPLDSIDAIVDEITGRVTENSPVASGTPSIALPAQLPPLLLTRQGAARMYRLAPALFPSLLNCLLKASVRASPGGDAARKNLTHLISALAPQLVGGCDVVSAKGRSGAVRQALVAGLGPVLDVYDQPPRLVNVAATLLHAGVVAEGHVLPSLRRRLVEICRANVESWNMDTATICCYFAVEYVERALTAEYIAADSPRLRSPGNFLSTSGWSSFGSTGFTPRQSLERNSSQPGSREGSPRFSVGSSLRIDPADFSAFPSGSPLPFPERLPPNNSSANITIISTMILCAGVLQQQAVLSLGHWLLQAIQNMFPDRANAVAITPLAAVALTQLLARNGRSFRVSTAAPNVKYCDAVIITVSRLVREMVRVGHFGRIVTTSDDVDDEGTTRPDSVHCAGSGTSLQWVPRYLGLVMQAVQVMQGTSPSRDAQTALGKLYGCALRFYVGYRTSLAEPPKQYNTPFSPGYRVVRPSGSGSASSSSSSPSPTRRESTAAEIGSPTSPTNVGTAAGTTRPSIADTMDISDVVLRLVLRTLDIVFHDYAAGYPDVLRSAVVQSAVPHSTLLQSVIKECALRSGDPDKPIHLDLLETFAAVASSDIDAAILAMPPGAPPRLAGCIPCGCDVLPFAGLPLNVTSDGGLSAVQKRSALHLALGALREGWWATQAKSCLRPTLDTLDYDEFARLV